MKMEFFGPPGCGKTYIVENIRGISRESIKAKANNPILSKIKKASRYSPISLYYKYFQNQPKSRKYRKYLLTKDIVTCII